MTALKSLIHPILSMRRLRASYRRTTSRVRSSMLWIALGRQKRWVRWTVLALVGDFVFVLLLAQTTAQMVDVGIVAQAVPLRRYFVPLIEYACLAFVAVFALLQLLARLSYELEFDLRVWIYTRLHAAKLEELDAVPSGQIVTRALTDLRLLQQAMALIPVMVTIVPILGGLLVVIFILSPLIGIFAASALPLNIWMLRRLRDGLRGLSWAELNERAEATAAIDEPVRGIRVVHAFGRQEAEQARVDSVSLRVYRFAMTRWRLLARYDVFMKAAPIVAQAMVLLVGAWLVEQNRLTLGTFLIAFQLVQIVVQFAQVLDQLASAWQYLTQSQSRLTDLLAMGNVSARAGREMPAPSEGLRIEKARVERGNHVVLTDLDLSAGPGQLVVVRGAPGSGKTTLASVAAGLLEPTAGRVTLDGVDLTDCDPLAVCRAVRVVAEEPFLFATSVRENLTLAAFGEISDTEIHKAVYVAGAEDIIAGFPRGLAGVIGDRGLTLSGGQRQRLALARALVVPPRVLVLDDALSAVNPALEIEILERLRAHAPQTSVICITRRQGPVALADAVVDLPEPQERATTAPAAESRNGGSGFMAAGGGDAGLARVINSLKLSTECPGIPDRSINNDTPPAFRDVVSPLKRVFGLAAVALVLLTIGQLAPSIMFGSVSDLVRNGRTGAIVSRVLLLISIGGAGVFGAYAFRVLSQQFAQGAIYLLRRRVFYRLSRLGIDFYDREMPGEVATRVVYDLDVVLNFLTQSAYQLLIGLAQFGIGVAVIFVLVPEVAPVVLLAVALIAVATAIEQRFNMRALARVRVATGRVTSIFEEDFIARRDIRSFAAVTRQTHRFVKACWDLRLARRWSQTVTNIYAAFLQLGGSVLGAAILYRTGNLVLAGATTVGAVLSVRLISDNATQPLSIISQAYTQFLEVRVSWRRLRQPFEVPIRPEPTPGAQICSSLVGEIAFDGVRFAYPHTGREVLHDVSFTISPGEIVALVGYTGAGKSSIAKLLQRTYDPNAGSVRMDGHDLRGLDLDSYRHCLGVVPQDAYVFRGTVGSNIAYGRPDASPEEIEEAAWAVGAGPVLSALPSGFDEPVEDEGRNLTGAQRQLIALARAWLTRPEVLVLDEATSSLDAGTERDVLEAVAHLGCTTLMVTHRESVVAAADKVIVLEAGRIVEVGTRASLTGTGGRFDALWGLSEAEKATVEVGATRQNGRKRSRQLERHA